MELTIAILGLTVAILAAGFAGWTAWESRRSAGASIASAKAAESSAAASEKAVQLEAQRFDWERTARLVLVRRMVSIHQVEQFENADHIQWPSAVGLELSNAGQAPALGLKIGALILGEYHLPVHSPSQSIGPGDSAVTYFELRDITLPPDHLLRMVVTCQ